jgi:hypothetical protein
MPKISLKELLDKLNDPRRGESVVGTLNVLGVSYKVAPWGYEVKQGASFGKECFVVWCSPYEDSFKVVLVNKEEFSS